MLQFLFHLFTMIMSPFGAKNHSNRRPKAFLADYQGREKFGHNKLCNVQRGVREKNMGSVMAGREDKK
jgi:hypothetical protein